MPRRFWVTIDRTGHPNLGAADAAPVLKLNFAEFAGRRWLWDRLGERSQKAEADPDKNRCYAEGERQTHQIPHGFRVVVSRPARRLCGLDAGGLDRPVYTGAND
jgi:hypothetical protein